MYLCLIITINRERSTLLVTVNTFCACVYFAATVGKLSYVVIVLVGHNDGCQYSILFPQPRSHSKMSNSCDRLIP